MLQTVLFPRSKFTVATAMKWLEQHKHAHHKVDITDHFLRFRQAPPGFKKYYTKTLENGVELVYGQI